MGDKLIAPPLNGALCQQQVLNAADEIQGPAVLNPLHIQDRATSKVAGSPLAWRKMSELEAAYNQARLGAKDSGEARNRLIAGQEYARLWDTTQSPGRDSTAAFDFCGGGQGLPVTEAQAASVRALVAIEMKLGQRDRIIIRAVCATGHTPAEAMVLAKLSKETRVTARLCEALDALADAIDRSGQVERNERKRGSWRD